MKILNSKLVMTIMLIGVFLYAMPAFAFEKSEKGREVPFTLDDRDRLIRLEEGFKALNQRIDSIEKSLKGEIQSLRELVYVVITGIFVLIGFVIWDRRTALAPAIRKSKELEEREELIEKALKEYAKVEPKLAEILKSLRII